MNDLIGRGFAFPPTIDSRGKLALTSLKNEISQAMQIIISTAPGERIMRPDFGCRIQELVFEPNSEETQATAARYVKDALGRWEPRITVDEVTSYAHEDNPALLVVEISYTVKGTQDPRSLVYPFYLLPDQA